MNRISSGALAVFCAVTLVGCGGSGSTIIGTDQNPRIRLVDGFGTPAAADLYVDSQLIRDDAGYQFVSDYNIFENGNHTYKFMDGAGASTLAQGTQLLELNQFYTVIGYRTSADTTGLMFLSDKPASSSADGQVRVPNASSAPVDVYVTLPDADISAMSPSVSNEQPGDTAAPYVVAPLSGTISKLYQVRITAPGSKAVIASSTVTLGSDQPKTVMVTISGGVQALTPLPTVDYNH